VNHLYWSVVTRSPSQCVLQLAGERPPRRFAPPLLMEEGTSPIETFQYHKTQKSLLHRIARMFALKLSPGRISSI
jgi:hypothetical protein